MFSEAPPVSPASVPRIPREPLAEIYLKPANSYVEMGQPVNFYTVVEADRIVVLAEE